MPQNIFDFAGKTALITGASRGIGKEIAKKFLQCGAQVVIHAKNADRLTRCKKELSSLGEVFDVRADLGKEAELEEAIAAAFKHLGRIDTLINNAGITAAGTIETITGEEWDKILDTNLKGAFLVTRKIVPLMKKQGSGCIINVASQAAIFGSITGGIHYTSSKGGLISFARGLAKELGPFNIRINTLMPGVIETEMTRNILKNAKALKMKDDIALKRWGCPEEVATVCLFLASDAASYITGSIIPVNGGLPSMLFI